MFTPGITIKMLQLLHRQWGIQQAKVEQFISKAYFVPLCMLAFIIVQATHNNEQINKQSDVKICNISLKKNKKRKQLFPLKIVK